MSAHDRLEAEIRNGRAVEEQIARLVEVATGDDFRGRTVSALPFLWESTLKGNISDIYRTTSKTRLQRFSDYMAANHPGVSLLVRVLPEHVSGFLRSEDEAGLSARTWNDSLRLLKSVFRTLEPTATAYTRYLRDLKPRKVQTVHRRPLSDEEINLVLRVAEERKEIIHGPLVTSAFTGMRRGDACTLKWEAVDLESGMIRTTARKTAEPLEIPLHDRLKALLLTTPRVDAYVWPQASELYLQDPGKVDARLRAVLAAAGYVDTRKPRGKHRPDLPALTPKETNARAVAAIGKAGFQPAKVERMKTVLSAYLLQGMSVREIAQAYGFGKGSVSAWLNEAERLSGIAILPRECPPPESRGTTREEAGGQRVKRGSRVGWHSLRASFVTACLSAGMAPEILGRATGHTAIEVARRHYFKPSADQVRREFSKAIPGLLHEGETETPRARMRDILEAMNARTWKRDRAELLKLMEEETK